jgi:hypothetical protein
MIAHEIGKMVLIAGSLYIGFRVAQLTYRRWGVAVGWATFVIIELLIVIIAWYLPGFTG